MATPALAQATLPEDLLEEIFLRIPTAADLARASSSCVFFHRAITDHRFLRRFRALHPPPLLGILCGDLIPAQPPHLSASIARAFEGFDFSCSFLPNYPGRWRERDVRDGRALFSAVPEGSTYKPYDYSPRDLVTELAVCDPLHRRYVMLPVLLDNLADLVHQPDIVQCDPCLAPPVEEDDNEGSSFRVVCLVLCTTKLVVFVFSSCAGQWRSDAVTLRITPYSLQWQHCAHGCFCWKINERNKVLLLDTHMDFSAVKLPRGAEALNMAFVKTGQGLEMFHLSDKIQHGLYHLFYSVLLRKDGNQWESKWQTKAVIPLPLNYRYLIYGVVGGYLLLSGYPEDQRPEMDYFSFNLQTLQLESFLQTGDYVIIGNVYAGYPPSLSPPTI